MKIIELNGKHSDMECCVDDSDYELINQFSWHGHQHENSEIYARSICQYRDESVTMLMHRLILGLSFDDNRFVDHKNHNCLYNCKSNLRIATRNQNQYNRKSGINSSSEYKGVYWHKRDKKWRAKIRLNNKDHCLGNFDDEISAAMVYDNIAKEFHGEFVNLNIN